MAAAAARTNGRRRASLWVVCSSFLMACLLAPVAQAGVMGVDLGSEFMKVSLVKPGTMMDIVTNIHSKRKTETMISFYQGERSYGADAYSLLTRRPEVTYARIPTLLGRHDEHPSVALLEEAYFPTKVSYNESAGGLAIFHHDEASFSPEELVAMILTHAKVAEGSCVVAGFGFEGYAEDGSVKGWNGISNMDILGFETATNTAEASKAWNKGTQKWLQRYVYFRNSESLLITYFVSAFWHGFYPGYYLFFFSIALVQTVQRAWQKKVSPMFASIPKLYHLLCIIVFSAYINYFSIVFQVLAWDRAMAVWKSANYWGHFATVAAYALTCILPSPKKEAAKKA